MGAFYLHISYTKCILNVSNYMEILSSCPTRISLLGGGTDIKSYRDTHGGLVLGMAINIRQHFRLTDENEVIEYPQCASEEFYKFVLRELGMPKNIGFGTYFDGPIESGLGSSAAATCAIIGAVHKYQGKQIDKTEIAELAYDIEVNRMGMFGGIQDQYHCSLGGVNLIYLKEKTDIIKLPPNFIQPLLPYLVMIYLGFNRKSPSIQDKFRELTPRQVTALDNIKQLTEEGIKLLDKKKIEDFGELMDEVWTQKKLSNSGTTNLFIDDIYFRARQVGAWGGKILGAGGGGHMLFVCPPRYQKRLIKELDLPVVDFSLDWTGLDVRKI